MSLRQDRIPACAGTRSGFTLVEVLIAVTLLTMVAGALFGIMRYVQESSFKIRSNIGLQDAADKGTGYLRNKLGAADRVVIESANAEANACLKLASRRVDEFKGYDFSSDMMITDGDYLGVVGNLERTVSFWIKAPVGTTAEQYLVKWGRHDLAGRNFGITANNGVIWLDFSGKEARATGGTNIRDDEWHHVLVTYAGSVDAVNTHIYVDGVAQALTFVGSGTIDTGQDGTTNDHLRLGAQTVAGDMQFDGVLADVRIWNVALGAGDAADIFAGRQAPDDIARPSLQLHWPMRSVPGDSVTLEDSSTNDRDGTLVNADVTTLLVETTLETEENQILAMYDADLDGLFSLHFNPRALDCPASPDANDGWVVASSDIYQPSDDGFFSVPGDDPAQVTLTYGIKGNFEGTETASLAEATRKISTSKSFKKAELCRTDSDLRFDVQDNPPPGCSIARAFALIETDYDPAQDELYLQNADFTVTDDGVDFVNIPFTPDDVIATWTSSTGVLEVTSNSNILHEPSVWATALQSVAYRAIGARYSTNKRIIFSLGYLPFKTEDGYHYYEFNSIPVNTTITYHDAYTASRSAANEFCGMQGYLATITSDDENRFLTDRFLTPDGGLPRGWIGGTDNVTEGVWRWGDGPEAGQQFWQGNGGGNPVATDGSMIASFTSETYDYDTSADDLRLHITTPTDPSISQMFHRWGVNRGSPIKNQPDDSGGEDYMQICGLEAGHGTWNDLPFDFPCRTENNDVDVYRVCGYYVEWGGRTGESDPGLVLQRDFDLATQREFCQVNEVLAPSDMTAASGVASAVNGVLVSASDNTQSVTVQFATDRADSRLTLTTTANVTVTGDNSAKLTVSGTTANLRAAIASLHYQSATGYTGTDSLVIQTNIAGLPLSQTVSINVL